MTKQKLYQELAKNTALVYHFTLHDYTAMKMKLIVTTEATEIPETWIPVELHMTITDLIRNHAKARIAELEAQLKKEL